MGAFTFAFTLSSAVVVAVDRSALVLGTNSSLSGVVLAVPLPLALVGGGDAPELGDEDEPDQSDDPAWVGEWVGECGGEFITLTRRAAYSLIRALRVCRPCARAVPRESGETLRICVKENNTEKGHVSFGSQERERESVTSKQTEDEKARHTSYAHPSWLHPQDELTRPLAPGPP